MIQGDAVVFSAGVIAACVTALWLLSLRLRDAGIADIWWGPGFAVIAWTASEAPLEANLRYGVPGPFGRPRNGLPPIFGEGPGQPQTRACQGILWGGLPCMAVQIGKQV